MNYFPKLKFDSSRNYQPSTSPQANDWLMPMEKSQNNPEDFSSLLQLADVCFSVSEEDVSNSHQDLQPMKTSGPCPPPEIVSSMIIEERGPIVPHGPQQNMVHNLGPPTDDASVKVSEGDGSIHFRASERIVAKCRDPPMDEVHRQHLSQIRREACGSSSNGSEIVVQRNVSHMDGLLEHDRSLAGLMVPEEMKMSSGLDAPDNASSLNMRCGSMRQGLKYSGWREAQTPGLQDKPEVILERRFEALKTALTEEVSKWMLTMESRLARFIHGLPNGSKGGLQCIAGSSWGVALEHTGDNEVTRNQKKGGFVEEEDKVGKKRKRTTLGKRKRENWSDEDNQEFIKTCNDNEGMEEMQLRRLLTRKFSPGRTYEQCVNHLRILRYSQKIPSAQNRVSEYKRQSGHWASKEASENLQTTT